VSYAEQVSSGVPDFGSYLTAELLTAPDYALLLGLAKGQNVRMQQKISMRYLLIRYR